jgi:ATP-dependent DNA ligase
MDALSINKIPTGNLWRYEPPWDGLRWLAFKNGKNIELQSKKANR